MVQEVSSIIRHLFGLGKTAEDGKLTSTKRNPPLLSYSRDIIKEHNIRHVAATLNGRHVVIIAPQQQQQEEAALDSLVEVGLLQPLITTNTHVKQEQQEAALDPSVEVCLLQQEHISNNDATVEKLQEQNFSGEAALENDVSSVTNILQQKQEEISDPLADIDFQQPLIATDSTDHVEEIHVVEETTKLIQNYEDCSLPPLSYYIDIVEEHNLNNEATVKKEEQNFNDEAAPEGDIFSITVTNISQQKQQEVTDPLAEDDFQQPLISADSTSTVGVRGNTDHVLEIHVVHEETKIQITRAEKSTSSKSGKTDINKKIGAYESRQKILLVGEGDFSFSASLAVAFGDASNIVASSLDEKADFLLRNYRKAKCNIKKLESRGALVIHGVDATKMADFQLLNRIKFNRIIFNFPHCGCFDDTASSLSRNQALVSGFLRNARRMIKVDGEIHVTHKISSAFIKWNIEALAEDEGLYLIRKRPFYHSVYPGYKTKYGFGGDNFFYCYPCKSYSFGHVCQLEG